MRKLIETFVRYPFYANIIIAIVIVGGLMSLSNMKLSFFPETTSRIIRVQVYYPGASPIEMEEGVTSLIEEAVRGVVGIKEITSESSENSSRVSIEILGNADIDDVLMEVKNAVDAIPSFPSAAERPSVYKTRNSTHALRIAVHGQVDLETLKHYAERIEDDLLNTGRISQISIQNNPRIEIAIEIREDELLRYNLTFDEVARAISLNNRDVSGGEIRNEQEELLIRLRSRSAEPEKIENIVVRGATQGALVRVKDVARVSKTIQENYYPTLINGQQALNIIIRKLNDEDLKEITQVAEEYIATFNAENSDVQISVRRKFLDRLYQRLDMVISNGVMGLILVILSLAFLLSFRLSLWVAFGIPFSFLAMFIIAQYIGVTINMMSLFGMILVIGILVDDGIVIGENIYAHFERGKTPARAAIDGTMEVVPAIMTSITTTIVAFSPLLFLVGGRMEMMVEMAIIVIICLALSLLEAFFILPAHLSNHRVLNRKSIENKQKGLKKYIDTAFIYLREHLYEKYIRWALQWRYAIVIGMPIFFTLFTIGLFRGEILQTTIFPNVAFDDFNVNIAFTPGSGSKQTYNYLQKIEQAIEQTNIEFTEAYKHEIIAKYDSLIPIINHYSTRVGYAFDGEEIGAHAGLVEVMPIELDGLSVNAQMLARSVQQKIGPIPEAQKLSVGARSRWGAPISISVMSRDIDDMEGAKNLLLQELEAYSELKEVKENNPLGKQEVKIHLTEKAYFLGLTEVGIANQIRQGFYGEQVQRIQEGRNEIRVWVRYPPEDRLHIGQLENMKIKTPQGTFPLSELVTFSIERGPVSINRLNGRRETRVEAEMSNPDASVTNMIARIRAEVLPRVTAEYSSVYLDFQGQARFGRDVGNDIQKGFTLAFIFIILLLIIHFRSPEYALIIILMIPVALLGSLWGHGFHGKPLSLMSLQGMIALTGVIINNAVVFLARYNDLVREGNSIYEATILAGKSRLRAIILTSLTTSAGLFPIIFETSIQAQFLIPMAISLAYGVLFGTIFILLLFPLLILVVNDVRKFVFFILKGKVLTREEAELNYIEKKRNAELDVESLK